MSSIGAMSTTGRSSILFTSISSVAPPSRRAIRMSTGAADGDQGRQRGHPCNTRAVGSVTAMRRSAPSGLLTMTSSGVRRTQAPAPPEGPLFSLRWPGQPRSWTVRPPTVHVGPASCASIFWSA